MDSDKDDPLAKSHKDAAGLSPQQPEHEAAEQQRIHLRATLGAEQLQPERPEIEGVEGERLQHQAKWDVGLERQKQFERQKFDYERRQGEALDADRRSAASSEHLKVHDPKEYRRQEADKRVRAEREALENEIQQGWTPPGSAGAGSRAANERQTIRTESPYTRAGQQTRASVDEPERPHEALSPYSRAAQETAHKGEQTDRQQGRASPYSKEAQNPDAKEITEKSQTIRQQPHGHSAGKASDGHGGRA
jgi:hypothetical protein